MIRISLFFYFFICLSFCDFIERESKPNFATLSYSQQHPFLSNDSLLFQYDFVKCPQNMSYVVLDRKINLFPKVIGCCPLNQKACVLSDEQRVIGCCPEQQECVVRKHGNLYRFMGCTDKIEQDCSYAGSICPIGYGCCRTFDRTRSFCAPHNGTVENFQEYCDNPIQRVPIDTFAFIDDDRIDESRKIPYTYYTTYKESDVLDNFLLFVNDTKEDPTIDPPQRLCNGTKARCHINETCEIETLTFLNQTNNSTLSFALETYCCPDNHELCYQRNDQPTDTFLGGFLGCANLALNETCCGDAICPNNHKCCTIDRFDNTLNQTIIVDQFCCPNELQCCYDHPENIVSFNHINPFDQPLSYGYCGLNVNGTDCAMDRQLNDNWYLLHLHKTGNFNI